MYKPTTILAGWVVVLLVRGAVVEADEALPSRVTPVVLAVRKAAPAVVNIITERIVLRRMPGFGFGFPFEDLFDWPRTPTRERGAGSGAIVTDTGYILTNAHVVADATAIQVSLIDKSRFRARLVSSDPESDLAVIKVNAPKPLPFIEMGISSDLMPGETVIALGNPFGYGHTVTVGVISAVKRDIVVRGRTVYRGLIQTDAAINPGNSGGPLVNIYGQLIGINTAIRAEAQNIGFAIPVDRVRKALVELLDFRRLNHTWLGLRLEEERLAGPRVSYRVWIKSVAEGSPAAKAGLAPRDLLLDLDGRPVRNIIDFNARILEKHVSDRVEITVSRAGRTHKVTLPLARAPRKPAAQLARERLGLVLQDLTPDLARQLRVPLRRGLLVAEVLPRSPAASAGIQPGDVIFQIGRYRIEHVRELGTVLERLRGGQAIQLGLVRGRFLIWVRLIAR